MSFPTGWTSSRLTIDNSKVPGTTNLTDFPVFINDVALGTTGVGTAIWSNSQGQEINTNRFLNDANLQAYYRFESTGTADSSGNGYNLTAYGSPTFPSGYFGQAFEGDDTDNYLAGGGSISLDNNSFSISLRFKGDTVTTTNALLSKGTATVTRQNLVILTNINSKIIFGFFGDDLISNLTVKTAEWYHLVCTYNSANNERNLYVNGIKDATNTSGGPLTNTDTVDFEIGRMFNRNDEALDGLIDDVAIFDRVLSDSEVLEIYKGGADIRITTDSAGTNLVDHEIVTWDSTNEKGEIWAKLGTVQATADTSFYIWYDNGTATTTSNGTAVWSDYNLVLHDGVTDSSPFLNNAGTQSGAVVGTSGKIGKDIYFDGVNDIVVFSHGTQQNLGTSFVVSYWLNAPGTAYGDTPYIAKRESGTDSYQFWGNLTNPMNYYNGTTTYSSGTINAPGDQYNYLAYIFDGTNINFYVNGIYAAGTTATQPATNSVPLKFGNDGGASYGKGYLDEIRFYNNATRSADWIATEYNNQNDPASFILTAIDFTRAISDNLSITDVIYREADFNRENTDNLAITDTVIRTFDQSITIQDNIVIITDQVVTTAVNVITIAQDIVGIDDTIFRQVDYSRNPQDTITLDDITDRSITYNRILDNSVGITDTIFSIKFIYASVLDNIGIADSVNIKSVTSDVDNPIIEFYQIDGITPTIYNITNG